MLQGQAACWFDFVDPAMKRPAASLHGPASSPIKRPAAKPKPKPKAKAKSKVIKAKDPPKGRSMDEARLKSTATWFVKIVEEPLPKAW